MTSIAKDYEEEDKAGQIMYGASIAIMGLVGLISMNPIMIGITAILTVAAGIGFVKNKAQEQKDHHQDTNGDGLDENKEAEITDVNFDHLDLLNVDSCRKQSAPISDISPYFYNIFQHDEEDLKAPEDNNPFLVKTAAAEIQQEENIEAKKDIQNCEPQMNDDDTNPFINPEVTSPKSQSLLQNILQMVRMAS